ncbi:hypothetical protein MPER_15420 [Moniliophthora perniciosa FA553]|nr:hypothetical protein MPER_15420 [Moniliophthora perniciosa FA553]
MYHQLFKCTVFCSTHHTPIVPAKPPVWCEDNQSKCVKGSKQMLYWHQLEGNNIQVDGYDLAGSPKSPAYNAKCGFNDGCTRYDDDSGAQNDIFEENAKRKVHKGHRLQRRRRGHY